MLIVTTGLIGDILRIIELLPNNATAKLCVMPYLFLNRRSPIETPQFNSMIFHQMKKDFLYGYLPTNPNDTLTLSGILMQYLHGDQCDSKSVNMSEIVPAPLLNKYTNEEWASKLKTSHFGFFGTSKDDCIRRFVKQCQQCRYYGAYHIDAELANPNDWKDVLDKNIHIAISENGLELLSRNLGSSFYSFPFSEIVRWHLSASDPIIEITVANRTSTLKIQSSRTNCMLIVRYLHGYVTAILAQSKYATAVVNYHPSPEEGSDLLRFNKGDVIHIIEHTPGNGWEFGTVDGNLKGNFPLSTVNHSPYLFDQLTHHIQTSVNTE